MTNRIPVTIIGGYLGAGKTTLVNQMLRQADGTKLAILVNEFGALPIDEDLIEAQEDELISISGGCICCSFGSDLAAAMLKLAELHPAPDHIVIEASGVALPGAIAHSIAILPGFRVEGICVLADCANTQKLVQDEYIGDTIERQLADADVLLLTKPDLVSNEELRRMQTWLSDRWPGPQHILSQHGRVPNAVLLGQFPSDPNSQRAEHHDRAYDSVVLRFDAPVDAQVLANRLTQPRYGLVRAKGFVDDISGARALIQMVGPRCEVTFPPDPAEAGLICIGLKERLNTHAIDDLAREQKTTAN